MSMIRALRTCSSRVSSLTAQSWRAMSSDKMGAGAGKGGGGGGSIRTAGGAFGEMEAAREEEYFRKLQAQQLKELHNHVEDEIHQHEAEINRLEIAKQRHLKKLAQLKEKIEDTK